MPKTLADMTAKVERLQAAVKEMLKALVDEEESHFYYYASPGETFQGSTIEDFGLTKEDME